MKVLISALAAGVLLIGATAAKAQGFDPSSGFGVGGAPGSLSTGSGTLEPTPGVIIGSMPNPGLIGSPPQPGIVQPAPGAMTAATPSLAPVPPASPINALPALGGIGSTPGSGFGSPTYDPNGMLPSIPDTGAASPGVSSGASAGTGLGAGY